MRKRDDSKKSAIVEYINEYYSDYVVALYNGLNNLKELAYEDNRYILRSCNEDKDTYLDIHVTNLQVQGVAVCVMHSFIKK